MKLPVTTGFIQGSALIRSCVSTSKTVPHRNPRLVTTGPSPEVPRTSPTTTVLATANRSYEDGLLLDIGPSTRDGVDKDLGNPTLTNKRTSFDLLSLLFLYSEIKD